MMAFRSVPEGGVLDCPLCEGEGGAAQNLLHGGRRRSWLLVEACQESEQPVGDVLGSALDMHGLSDLLGGDLLPVYLLADGLADKADPIALGEGLRAGEHVGVSSVCSGMPLSIQSKRWKAVRSSSVRCETSVVSSAYAWSDSERRADQG
jgi:hypothetical protein